MRRRVQELEWDAIAAVIAVLVAFVLNLLQVANTEILVTVALVLVALLLVRDLRREAGDLRTELALGELKVDAERIRALLATPGIVLIGPRQLRAASWREPVTTIRPGSAGASVTSWRHRH